MTTLRQPRQCLATRNYFTSGRGFYRHDGVLEPAANHAINVPRSYADNTDHWKKIR